jgi:hypothetical protein
MVLLRVFHESMLYFGSTMKVGWHLIVLNPSPDHIERWAKEGSTKEDTVANFDMRGQRVSNQYNAGRDMNFGAVQTPADLITALELLNEQFVQEKEAGVLSEETATDAQYQVTKAAQQAKRSDPDKQKLMDHLTTAKTLIEGVTAASGLVTALAAAIQIVQKLFS